MAAPAKDRTIIEELQRQNDALRRRIREIEDVRSGTPEIGLEEMLRTALDHMPAKVSYIDRDGRYLFSNKTAEEWFGVSRDAFRGRPAEDLLGKASYQIAREYMARAERGLPTTHRNTITHADGTRRVVETVMHAHRGVSGDVDGFFVVSIDVTNRLEYELALEQSERRYRRLIDLLPDGVSVICDGRLVYLNSAYAAMYGADDPSQLIGTSPTDRVHPDDLLELRRIRDENLSRDEPTPRFRGRRFRLDGSIFEAESTLSAVKWQDRDAAIVVVRDITESMNAERALKETELRLSGVAANVPGAIFQHIRHPDGVTAIPYVSAGIFALTGYEVAEIVAEPELIFASIDADHRNRVRARIEESARDLTPVEVEYRLRTKDGRYKWVQQNARPRLRSDGGVIWEGLIFDVTDRNIARIALTQAKDAAETANRTKSEFLANMSHELRTPLNAIIGFSEVLKNQMFGPLGHSRYGEYVDDIYASGRHLLQVINDILDLSKVEAGKAELYEESVDLAEVIDSTIRIVRQRTDNNRVDIVVSLAESLPRLRADERKLKQIFLNLLSNASKFTPAGGRVEIEADFCPNFGMTINVRDNGIGIDVDDIEKALSPFGQVESALSRKYEGTGLGLPLTKSLVELHDGELDLSSDPGKGTTVTLTFPASRFVA